MLTRSDGPKATTSAVAMPAGRAPVAWHAAVIAAAVVRASPHDLEALRQGRSPDDSVGPGRRSSQLRQAADQTLAALGAVASAMAAAGGSTPLENYGNWGLLAASQCLGRSRAAMVLKRFGEEGVWGVTPHLSPHLTLHSPSGTLSQILKIQGPNLGVGGGPDATRQGLLTALTWLRAGMAPGVWLVASGWVPDPPIDEDGEPLGASECCAVALALRPASEVAHGMASLTIRVAEPGPMGAPLDLAVLAALIEDRGKSAVSPRGIGTPTTRGGRTHRLDAGHAPAVFAGPPGVAFEVGGGTYPGERP